MKQNIPLIFIQITNLCNLNCAYCPFANTTIKQTKLNTAGYAKQEDLKSYNLKKVLSSSLFSESSFGGLIIYGGEPLLNIQKVKETILLYKSIKPNGTVTICTNGLKINDELINFSVKNKVHFSINMDGDFELVRKIKTITKDQYDNIIENLKKLKLKSIAYDFSTTLTPKFLLNFKKQITFLENLQPVAIGFNYLRDGKARKEFSISDPHKYYEQAMTKVFLYDSKLNFARNKKLETLKTGTQKDDCICCGLGITLLSNGNITTCGIFGGQEFKNLKAYKQAIKQNKNLLYSNKNIPKKIRNLETFGGGCAKLNEDDNIAFAENNAKVSFNLLKSYEKI